MMKMGRYFQIQDDYLDCFGTPEQIGKIGRDIEENKCGWLAVQALKLCNEAQVRIHTCVSPTRIFYSQIACDSSKC